MSDSRHCGLERFCRSFSGPDLSCHPSHRALASNPLNSEAVEEIAQSILTQIAANDYALLRQFRGNSSLATYLTVIARRICLEELTKRGTVKPLPPEFKPAPNHPPRESTEDNEDAEADIDLKTNASLESLEQVQRLVRKLPARERDVVRMYYLEGRTYEEISTESEHTGNGNQADSKEGNCSGPRAERPSRRQKRRNRPLDMSVREPRSGG